MFDREQPANSAVGRLTDWPGSAQVMEMVRDCLSKSRERCVTSRYFYDLSENLEKLLNEVCDRSAGKMAV